MGARQVLWPHAAQCGGDLEHALLPLVKRRLRLLVLSVHPEQHSRREDGKPEVEPEPRRDPGVHGGEEDRKTATDAQHTTQ